MSAASSLHQWENGLLLSAVIAYLLAMLSLWGQMFFRADDSSTRVERWHNGAGHIGHALLFGGVALHLPALLVQGATLFSSSAGVAGLFGWVLAVAYLLFGVRLGRSALGAFVTPLALVATLHSLTSPLLPRTQILETQWQLVHVVLIVIGYVSLAFAFAASLLYLLQEGLLKRKQLNGLWQRLPSLQVADELIYRATAFGLAMLTLGLFIGVVWQQRYHPEYAPLHDPKVILSLLTWITFAAYLGARWRLGWRGRRTNLVVVYGFVLLVISFFGAPHVLHGVAR